ncbi:DUF1175 family protein [Meiothermus hypogaeus]|uniref:NlpC/P60 domain-containing protein n=2 Tax=Meiothermus hypogaeus TaxID=884155 RepID=A0A511QXG3_9DEIN|nr:DUF1175 family protein [Meiothermus hypogaeus]RIH80674.1 hypothetical protein Mhypo_00390 [Meiothermus hypogaeus]GEM82071.1 hypothetical protein MHY01S_02370 [Meiothermus hypogaeus NBRC 106114]
MQAASMRWVGRRLGWVALGLCGLALAAPLGPARPNLADLDQDGYPDIAELHGAAEREAFLEWFAAIAEAQFTAPSPAWLPQEQDCAGLLRFAFFEALKPKTTAWFQKFPYLPKVQVPPLSAYPLPQIGRAVFRIEPGAYRPNDVQAGRLVSWASAVYLMRYSSVLLGRTPDKARRGDLLFFVHPLAKGSAYHSMVYLGNGLVVYHTGYAPSQGGEVRLVSLQTLNQHPQKYWHPRPDNPYFLGFYRWKIVSN